MPMMFFIKQRILNSISAFAFTFLLFSSCFNNKSYAGSTLNPKLAYCHSYNVEDELFEQIKNTYYKKYFKVEGNFKKFKINNDQKRKKSDKPSSFFFFPLPFSIFSPNFLQKQLSYSEKYIVSLFHLNLRGPPAS